MPQDNSLKELVDGRAKYREGVTGKTFQPFEKAAPSVDIDALTKTMQDDQSPARQAAAQNAVDFAQAHQRAVDMRKMTHKDYIDAYNASAASISNYERTRVARFTKGQV